MCVTPFCTCDVPTSPHNFSLACRISSDPFSLFFRGFIRNACNLILTSSFEYRIFSFGLPKFFAYFSSWVHISTEICKRMFLALINCWIVFTQGVNLYFISRVIRRVPCPELSLLFTIGCLYDLIEADIGS